MKLTNARRAALAVLTRGKELGEPVRVSNSTSDTPPLTVYWQSHAWLEDQGLVTSSGVDGELELTAGGVQLARTVLSS